MNPIEKALATADRVVEANKELERLSREAQEEAEARAIVTAVEPMLRKMAEAAIAMRRKREAEGRMS